jgi:hypothetical protein
VAPQGNSQHAESQQNFEIPSLFRELVPIHGRHGGQVESRLCPRFRKFNSSKSSRPNQRPLCSLNP